jgi:hypothetical protein
MGLTQYQSYEDLFGEVRSSARSFLRICGCIGTCAKLWIHTRYMCWHCCWCS